MEAEPTEDNDNMEIENFLEKAPPAEEEEEMQCRMSPLSHSYPDVRKKFLDPTKSSRRKEQQWEQNLKQKEEEWKEEMDRREKELQKKKKK